MYQKKIIKWQMKVSCENKKKKKNLSEHQVPLTDFNPMQMHNIHL